MKYKIIETDYFVSDYPNEKFVNLPTMREEHAKDVADAINAQFPEDQPRYWRAVPEDYVLQPGFEP